ncbi:agmatinase [Candidatus Micrarchaeota archaeon]|nr:agmatinase [Candidatus Micrarchaeota archaeon]
MKFSSIHSKALDVFLGYSFPEPAKAKVTVLPVAYEGTVSYAQGTADGPRAIIDASKEIEFYDEETGTEPYEAGIITLKELKPAQEPEKAVEEVEKAVAKIIADKKFPVVLGGEHSISIGAARALKKKFPSLSVLQFDAHADLRDEYDDSKYSHACAMRRIIEDGCRTVQVGIRSTDKEPLEWSKGKTKIFWAREKARWKQKEILDSLGEDVYITFDVDAFDPSIMPSTGTPEPGGLLWDETLALLRKVFSEKNVVGVDVVEFAPIQGMHAPDFTAAKLVYKMIAYKFEKELATSST